MQTTALLGIATSQVSPKLTFFIIIIIIIFNKLYFNYCFLLVAVVLKWQPKHIIGWGYQIVLPVIYPWG